MASNDRRGMLIFAIVWITVGLLLTLVIPALLYFLHWNDQWGDGEPVKTAALGANWG